MAYCANCGNPLNEGQRFCPVCGHQLEAGSPTSASAPAGAAPGGVPVGAPQPQYAPPPQQQQALPPQQGYQTGYQPGPGYQPGWTYYPQGQPGAPPRRSRKGLWIGLSSALLVIVVACVLVFVVFRGDIFGGGSASSPEQAVGKFLTAMEKKDVDTLLGLIDPEAMSSVLNGETVDQAKADMRDSLFNSGGISSIKFSGIKMSTKLTGDDSATVTLTAGKVIVTDENGNVDTSDVKEADALPTIDLVKRDGSWYIDPASFDFFSGADDLPGSTTTDTTDQGPPTTVASGTTSTEGSTSTTLFTTSTAVGGGSGAKTPQEVVMRLFDAMEKKDTGALISLFDPVALQEMAQGVSMETLAGMLGETMFDYESVTFSGIQVDVEFQDDANATVTVTEGMVTITDNEGTTSTEDVRDAGEPVVLNVVLRDGFWYADPTTFVGGV